jgi:hypothetical protein
MTAVEAILSDGASPSSGRASAAYGDSVQAEPRREWTSREKFAFRWAVLFFRSFITNWVITYVVPSSLAAYTTWLRYLDTGYPNPAQWFQNLWPPCPGCDYNPMYWQVSVPWAFLTATAGAVVWRLLDRDRVDYRRWYAVWHTIMRYSLGINMIGWGFFKITGSQFWGLHADAFLIARPLGEWASRALMWNTMGQSVMYGDFSGFTEIVGGTLLLFRRTTLLGAIILFFVSGTIFLLDALMNRGGVTTPALWGSLVGLALVAPEWGRLKAFYGRNEPLRPLAAQRPIPGRAGALIQAGVLVLMLYKSGTFGDLQALVTPATWDKIGWRMVPHPMTGVFKVTSMSRNGAPVIPRYDDTTQWSYIGFGGKSAQTTNMRGGRKAPEALFIIRPDGAIHEGYGFTLDSVKRTMTVDTTRVKSLQGMQFTTWHGDVKEPFSYEWTDIDHLTLRGVISGDTIVANLQRSHTQQTVLFASRRLVKNHYSIPIKWSPADTVRHRSQRGG